MQIPGIGSSFWVDRGAFLQCRRVAKRRHAEVGFEAILAFDLVGVGGVAWRLGQYLNLPTSGWAFGSDLRVSPYSGFAEVVRRTLTKLDIVFYQSRELRRHAAMLLGTRSGDLNGPGHVVLPHGIAAPPELNRRDVRNRLRSELHLRDDQPLIVSVGRLTRPKGVFDLVEAFGLAADSDPSLRFAMIGANPAFDESEAARQKSKSAHNLDGRLSIMPACPPEKVWEFLCAADIFAFASHGEGMPNSLLEAMAMGVPVVAFGIPPVLEIEDGTDALLIVSPFDCREFADALLALSASESARLQMGARAQQVVRSRFDVRRNMETALNLFQHRIERTR